MSTLAEIQQAALHLPDEERRTLRNALDQTLDDCEMAPEVWAEMMRRRDELLSGAVRGVSHDEFRNEMRMKFPWWP